VQEKSDIEWKKIIAFRNFVVHKYFGIEPGIVFEVATKEIPLLEKNVLNLIKRMKDKKYLLQAMGDTKTVLSKLNRRDSVAYLKKIEGLINNG